MGRCELNPISVGLPVHQATVWKGATNFLPPMHIWVTTERQRLDWDDQPSDLRDQADKKR